MQRKGGKVRATARAAWTTFSDDLKGLWLEKALDAWGSRVDDAAEREELRAGVKAAEKERIDKCFWGLGSKAGPISAESFTEVVASKLGEGKMLGGYTACKKLRDELTQNALIQSECIQKGEINAGIPCWQRCPGLCVTDCAWCWREAVDIARKIESLCPKSSVGQFVKLRCTRVDGSAKHLLAVVSFRSAGEAQTRCACEVSYVKYD